MDVGNVLRAIGQQDVSVEGLPDAKQVTWILCARALHVPPASKADGRFISESGSFHEVFSLYCSVVFLQAEATIVWSLKNKSAQFNKEEICSWHSYCAVSLLS